MLRGTQQSSHVLAASAGVGVSSPRGSTSPRIESCRAHDNHHRRTLLILLRSPSSKVHNLISPFKLERESPRHDMCQGAEGATLPETLRSKDRSG